MLRSPQILPIRITGMTKLGIFVGYFQKTAVAIQMDGESREAKIAHMRGTIDPGVFEIVFLVNKTGVRATRIRVPYYVTRDDRGGNGYRCDSNSGW